MYLWFHKEKELAKYNIFSTSLLIASNVIYLLNIDANKAVNIKLSTFESNSKRI